jgi:hypothetical protein
MIHPAHLPPCLVTWGKEQITGLDGIGADLSDQLLQTAEFALLAEAMHKGHADRLLVQVTLPVE